MEVKPLFAHPVQFLPPSSTNLLQVLRVHTILGPTVHCGKKWRSFMVSRLSPAPVQTVQPASLKSSCSPVVRRPGGEVDDGGRRVVFADKEFSVKKMSVISQWQILLTNAKWYPNGWLNLTKVPIFNSIQKKKWPGCASCIDDLGIQLIFRREEIYGQNIARLFYTCMTVWRFFPMIFPPCQTLRRDHFHVQKNLAWMLRSMPLRVQFRRDPRAYREKPKESDSFPSWSCFSQMGKKETRT